MSSFVVSIAPAYASEEGNAIDTAGAITVQAVLDPTSKELYLTLFDANGDAITPSAAEISTPPFPGLPAQVVINLNEGGGGAG